MNQRDDLEVKSGTPDQPQLIRYLLGELPEQECREFEQRCLESDELFEELQAVEAELTDDYVRGVLVGHRRKSFEERLLHTPGRSDEIQFARLMVQADKTRPSSLFAGLTTWIHSANLSARWLQTSIAAAAVALLVAIGLFSLRHEAPLSGTAQISRPESPANDREAGHPGTPQIPTIGVKIIVQENRGICPLRS